MLSEIKKEPKSNSMKAQLDGESGICFLQRFPKLTRKTSLLDLEDDEFVYRKEREGDTVYLEYSTHFDGDDPYIILDIWVEPKDDGGEGGQQGGEEVNPFEDEIANIALVGSFNDWALESEYRQFQKIDATHSYILENCYLAAGEEFKIVVNNSWTFVNGGIGYDDIQSINNYLELFEKGPEYNNVKVKKDVLFTITVSVEGEHLIARMEAAAPSEK